MDILQMDAQQLADLIRKSPYFDAEWYKQEYPEIEYHEDGNPDPAYHYANYGYKENRLPSLLFDGNLYLKYVSNVNINPLAHFIANGAQGDYTAHSRFNEILLKVDMHVPLTKSERILWLQQSYQDHFSRSINLLKNTGATLTSKLYYLIANYKHDEMLSLLDPALLYDHVRKHYGYSHEETYDVAFVTDDVDSIDLKSLPQRFFIKCAGTEQSVEVIKSDSIDINKLKQICSQLLAICKNNINTPYLSNIDNLKAHLVFLTLRSDVEKQKLGKDIKQDVDDINTCNPSEIYFYCCNGHVAYISTRSKPNAKTYFDRDFNMLSTAVVDINNNLINVSTKVEKPAMFETMISKAESIAKQHPFLKVGFNLYGDEFVLNSVSFAPDFGHLSLLNNYDLIFGYKLDLS